MMRFHVPALPHTNTSAAHCACAYTQKVRKFCRMMTSLGHKVFHYGVEGADVCAEHVSTMSTSEQRSLVGPHDPKTQCYNFPWNPEHPAWSTLNSRAASEISKRAGERDFLCLIGGTAQKPISDALPQLMAVEYGIGYGGAFAPYRVYESYAHRAKVQGSESPDPDGRFFDTVIPNYWDTAEFPEGDGRGGYFLFVGRLVKRKGLRIAVQMTEQLGKRLIIAGQGARHFRNCRLECDDGEVYEGGHLDFVGHVDPVRRAELMGGAIALLAPTIYLEPFGGVVCEAALCGTPAITTDWGAFPETIEHGRTGFRCYTLQEFIDAGRDVAALDRSYIRARAQYYWSLESVAQMYQRYFERLLLLWEAGWGQLRESHA